MGFLAPVMLFAAASIALPLYLHLLRRRRSEARPFSSLMFFEPRPPRATERRRLRFWPLLALRLCLLLLLAAAFAEPYVRRSSPAPLPAARLIVAIDDSFSMRAAEHFAAARRGALALIGAKPEAQRVQLLALGEHVRVLTAPTADPRALRAALEALTPSDERASLGALATALRTLARSDGTPVELHLFSDLQQTSLPASFTELTLPANTRLVLHGLGAAPANWAVLGVDAPAQVFGASEARVQASIAGYGTPPTMRTVSLVVNGQVLASRAVQLPASGRAVVQFEPARLGYGINRCVVRIDPADALPEDDQYAFTIERAESVRGLLLHEAADERSPRYLATALQAAVGPGVRLDQETPGHAAALDPRDYGFVILSDVTGLPSGLEQRLQGYLRAGGSVLVALGTSAGQRTSVPILDTSLQGARAYAREAQRFELVGRVDQSHPLLVGSAEAWERVKFYYVTLPSQRGARVAIALADGTPLLTEQPVGAGRALLFASGFDNLTNDLPLHAEVSLQTVIREWEPNRQAQALTQTLRELGLLRLRIAQEYVSLLQDYYQVVQAYVQELTRGSTSPLSVKRAARMRATEFAVQQLDLLDARRLALRPSSGATEQAEAVK